MKSFVVAAAVAGLAAAAPVEQKRTDAPYGNKKGVSYDVGDNGNIGPLSTAGGPTWAYNWAGSSDGNAFQYIPMCWGPGCDAGAIQGSISGGAPWVLGYNEPDMCGNGGSCHSPQDAYNTWGNDMFPFKQAGAKLVCPAITSDDTQNGPGGFASGLTWLDQFAHTSGGGGSTPDQFQCDAQALHWYGPNDGSSGSSQGDLFIQYVQNANGRVNQIFGKNMDLWITEFAPMPMGDAGVLADFLGKVIPWLDSQDYVARYAPFKGMSMIDNGGLNGAGNALVSTN